MPGSRERILCGIAIGALFTLICSSPPLSSDTASAVTPVVLGFSGPVEQDGLPRPWSLTQKTGKAGVSVESEEGVPVLRMKSSDASFSVERPLSLALSEHPCLTWSWKAVGLPRAGDVRIRERNDQALQIIIAFEKRRILSYVWDSNAPVGTVADESIGWPISLSVKVIVVRSGSDGLGRWITETRNIADDYRNLFHEAPPPVKGIRIQANTQHTKDSAEGFVKLITFCGREGIPHQ